MTYRDGGLVEFLRREPEYSFKFLRREPQEQDFQVEYEINMTSLHKYRPMAALHKYKHMFKLLNNEITAYIHTKMDS